MAKHEVRTEYAPAPAGAYSQGVVTGGFLYTAGVDPEGPVTGAVADSVGEQTAQVLRNIQAVLAQHGLTLDDVVKSTVHLEHLKRDFFEFNEVYQSFFSVPYPARTTVGSNLMNILVEVDVVTRLRD